MNKVVVGMLSLAVFPFFAYGAEPQMAEFCAKHCNAMQLRQEVQTLEKAIEKDRASLKKSPQKGKLTSLNAQKEKVKKHLLMHEKELNDVKTELAKAEAELAQFEPRK